MYLVQPKQLIMFNNKTNSHDIIMINTINLAILQFQDVHVPLGQITLFLHKKNVYVFTCMEFYFIRNYKIMTL